jgi:hypothetical protein
MWRSLGKWFGRAKSIGWVHKHPYRRLLNLKAVLPRLQTLAMRAATSRTCVKPSYKRSSEQLNAHVRCPCARNCPYARRGSDHPNRAPSACTEHFVPATENMTRRTSNSAQSFVAGRVGRRSVRVFRCGYRGSSSRQSYLPAGKDFPEGAAHLRSYSSGEV